MDGLAGAVLLDWLNVLGNSVTASFAVVVVIEAEVATEVLGVVARVVVVFSAAIMLFPAVVCCSLVAIVVRGVSNIVVLLSFEGALAVNSPANTTG